MPSSQIARSTVVAPFSVATRSTSSRVMSRMNPAGTRSRRAVASAVQTRPVVVASDAGGSPGSNFVFARSVSQPAPSLSRPTVSSIIGSAHWQVMTGILRERAYFSIRALARRRRYASVTSRSASRASADHFTRTPGSDSSSSIPPS